MVLIMLLRLGSVVCVVVLIRIAEFCEGFEVATVVGQLVSLARMSLLPPVIPVLLVTPRMIHDQGFVLEGNDENVCDRNEHVFDKFTVLEMRL